MKAKLIINEIKQEIETTGLGAVGIGKDKYLSGYKFLKDNFSDFIKHSIPLIQFNGVKHHKILKTTDIPSNISVLNFNDKQKKELTPIIGDLSNFVCIEYIGYFEDINTDQDEYDKFVDFINFKLLSNDSDDLILLSNGWSVMYNESYQIGILYSPNYGIHYDEIMLIKIS